MKYPSTGSTSGLSGAMAVIVVASLSGFLTGCGSRAKPAGPSPQLTALADRLETDRRLFDVSLGVVDVPPQGYVMEARNYQSPVKRRYAESRRDSLSRAYYFVRDLSQGRNRPQPFVYSCVIRPGWETSPRTGPSLPEKYEYVLDIEYLHHLTAKAGQSNPKDHLVALELASGDDKKSILKLTLPQNLDDLSQEGRHIWWLDLSEGENSSDSGSGNEVIRLAARYLDSKSKLYAKLVGADGSASDWTEVEVFVDDHDSQQP